VAGEQLGREVRNRVCNGRKREADLAEGDGSGGSAGTAAPAVRNKGDRGCKPLPRRSVERVQAQRRTGTRMIPAYTPRRREAQARLRTPKLNGPLRSIL
jgi:hypothetical protein